MASLFAMASLVSAGFVEEVFSKACELMTTSSASTGNCVPVYTEYPKCHVKTSVTWKCVPGCTQRHEDKSSLGTCQCP